MANPKVATTGTGLLKLIEAKMTAGALHTTRGVVLSGTFSPSSPLILDSKTGGLQAVSIETVGVCILEVSVSANAPNPDNQQAIDDAEEAGTTPPAPIYDNAGILWHIFDNPFRIKTKGLHDVAKVLQQHLGGRRYLRLEPIRGDQTPKVYPFVY